MDCQIGIGDGLTLDWRIGDRLTWIGNGLILDWRIGPGLTLKWRIGNELADLYKIDNGMADWHWIGIRWALDRHQIDIRFK